jgi:hypothetical protein
MKTYPYSLSYYDSVPQRERKSIRVGFNNIVEAINWALRNEIPLGDLYLTKWDNNIIDSYGCPEISGGCSLEEAFDSLSTLTTRSIK